MDRGAETGDHHAAVGAVENLLHAGTDRALGLGVPRLVRVGGIGEQQQHAPFAVVGQRVQVEQFVIDGSGIHLVIAGVDDHPERRGDGQRHGAYDRVGDVYELDLEGPDFHNLLGLDGDEARFALQFVLLQAAFHQRQRESGAVDRHVDFGEEKRSGPDVILVAVRQDKGANHLPVVLQVRQVGHDQVDAQQLSFGKHHPGIDHDDVVAEPEGGHVHPELAQPAYGNNL